jgi:response regulator NasT
MAMAVVKRQQKSALFNNFSSRSIGIGLPIRYPWHCFQLEFSTVDIKINNNISSKHNILLVDDDLLILVILSEFLTNAGYNIKTAESVDDAEAMLAGGERPDLAILDVSMPGRNGLELAERLRSLDHIPFMLLTAYSDHKIVKQAASYGAMGYLVKPVVAQQLVPAIEAALARAADFQELRSSEQQLQKALDSEREINIAIGITMVQHQLDRMAAFELLRKTARSQHRKLADLALQIINTSGHKKPD